MFKDIQIEKNKFYSHKCPVILRDVDIEKVLVSNKIYSGKKVSVSSKKIELLKSPRIIITLAYLINC